MPSRPFSPNPSPIPHSIHRVNGFLLAISISAAVLLSLGFLFLLLYLWNSLFNRSRTSPFDSNTSLRLHKFSYKDLKSATNVFDDSNSIGKGGSGTVFRGILRDGKSVAVKKLDSTSLQAEREFQNELQVLGCLRSPYVITLLGYCIEKKKSFLVYEYMPNRSLQELLFAEGPAVPVLDWNQRFEIIVDIARALAFLHLECYPPVIHGDIKPSNVLLSSDYRAKLSDFGLSRIKSEEGEFGVDLFSQELGRSQELLWKSQDLSGNLAAVPPETPTETTSAEVDFVQGNWQASSSKNSRIKSLNSNPSTPNAKGKEAFALGMVGEDFGDDLYGIDHSKELNLNAYVPIDDTATNSKKQWGKDWWWRQDGSGELCSKDYVREWIGSQIFPSMNSDWDEEKKSSPGTTTTNMDYSMTQMGQLENEQGHRHLKKFEKKQEKGGNNGYKKQRKMQDWWKEESLAEIRSKKKGDKLRKLETSYRKAFKIPHFHLGRRFRHRKATTFEEHIQNDFDPNVEFSFRKGWKKKKKTHSTGSDMWSGDLFSRELSSTTSVRGTVCYVAPEYGSSGYLMEKADLYSLGVLILVIVSGRRPLHVLSSPMKFKKANLISWCRQLAQTGNVLELVDERLKETYNKDQASLCINLALLCIQKMPELRPDAGEIVKILKGEMDIHPLQTDFSPSPSKLYSRSRRKQKIDVE